LQQLLLQLLLLLLLLALLLCHCLWVWCSLLLLLLPPLLKLQVWLLQLLPQQLHARHLNAWKLLVI
jgi:hypothetical protein